MNDKQIDEIINKALQEEQTVPEGLAGRLEKQIDSWAAAEEKTTRSLHRRLSLYWLTGIAAAALLCVGIFRPDVSILQPRQELADTFKDPKKAAQAAQKALLLMSQNLNKGIDQAQQAQQEINKVNSILNKHIKE